MAFPTTGILDNFNRTNDPHPVTGWTDYYNGWDLVSNAFKGSAAADWSVSYWNAGTFQNCEGYFTITTKDTTNGSNVWLEFRVAQAGTNEYGYYIVAVTNSSGNDSLTLGYQDAGGTHSLLDVFQEVSNGDSIGFSANDSTLQLWYKASGGSWTQLGTDVTDTTYTAAGYLELSCYGTAWVIDDFGGGTIVSGGGGTAGRYIGSNKLWNRKYPTFVQ